MIQETLFEPAFREGFSVKGQTLSKELSVRGNKFTSSVNAKVASPDRYSWWKAYLAGERPQISNIRRSLPSGGTNPRSDIALRTADLFCGPGGFALGLRQAASELGISFKSAAIADIDKAALDVYEANHGPGIKSSGSVANIANFEIANPRINSYFSQTPKIVDPDWRELVGEIDILLAGPPCQGHSNLNNHTRYDDPRNELYLTVPAIAVALRAPMVLIENVESVVQDQQGVVQTAIELFKSCGYQVSSGVLDAATLGWPQTRKRYFLVASQHGPPLPLMQVADEFAVSEPRDVMWAIGDLVGVAPDNKMNRRPVMSKQNINRIQWLQQNDVRDLAIDQRPHSHQNEVVFNQRRAVYGRMHPDRPSPTITTGFMTPGRGRFIHPTEPRVLTPLEAARIQGFPDTYVWQPPGSDTPTSSSLAKWIGNAVPMPLSYIAALSVLASLV
jgi:DNA (cytosine-5)-methyltransferase 1